MRGSIVGEASQYGRLRDGDLGGKEEAVRIRKNRKMHQDTTEVVKSRIEAGSTSDRDAWPEGLGSWNWRAVTRGIFKTSPCRPAKPVLDSALAQAVRAPRASWQLAGLSSGCPTASDISVGGHDNDTDVHEE